MSMNGWFTAIAGRAAAGSLARDGPKRLMGITAKGVNRAAEHGTRSPVTQSVNIEEVEEEINKGKEEKQRKKKEVEKKVDSKVKSTTEEGSS